MRMLLRCRVIFCLAGVLGLGAAGCSPQQPSARVKGYRHAPPAASNPVVPQQPATPSQPAPKAIPSHKRLGPSNTAEGKELADQLMLASEGVLADCQVLGNHRLRVIVGDSVTSDVLPDLARALIAIMHETFPEADVTVEIMDRQQRRLLHVSLDVSARTLIYSFPD